MLKRSSKNIDSSQLQANQEDSASHGKNPAAVELGRLGGLKGGKARANKLSAEERRAIARKAARRRWGYDDED